MVRLSKAASKDLERSSAGAEVVTADERVEWKSVGER